MKNTLPTRRVCAISLLNIVNDKQDGNERRRLSWELASIPQKTTQDVCASVRAIFPSFSFKPWVVIWAKNKGEAASLCPLAYSSHCWSTKSKNWYLFQCMQPQVHGAHNFSKNKRRVVFRDNCLPQLKSSPITVQRIKQHRTGLAVVSQYPSPGECLLATHRFYERLQTMMPLIP